MQNGFIESFNGRLRDELLNETPFSSLNRARAVLAIWRADYNGSRPHIQSPSRQHSHEVKPPERTPNCIILGRNVILPLNNAPWCAAMS
jgi:hypothetical protein